MVKPWSFSGLSLCVCPATLSDVFSLGLQAFFVHCPHSHLPHRIVARVFRSIYVWTSTFQLWFLSSPEYSHFPKYAFCEVSPVGIPNMCSHALCGAFTTSGFHKCRCGTIDTMFSQVPGWGSQDLRSFFPSCSQLLEWDEKCILSVLLSTSGFSLQQISKWRNLPGVVHLGLHVVLPWCSWFHGNFSLFVTFGIVSCSRVCLLVVSRLLGLTLRPFASVCSCHWDSLTRGRLAIQQIFVKHQKGDLPDLPTQTVSTNIVLPDQWCRRDAAVTTGTLGSDVEKKMPSKNRLRWNCISLSCRRRPNMSIMTFFQIASSWPITYAARFSSTRTPFPTSMWSPTTL